MATTISTPNLLNQLQSVDKAIDQEIASLTRKKQALHATITTFSGRSLNAPTQPPKRRRRRQAPNQLTLAGVGKKGPQKATATVSRAPRRGQGATTMDMVRQVLTNTGRELTPAQLRAQIQADFGVAPASSLLQMLYKRSKKGTGFYRLPDGTYGLMEWKSNKQTPVTQAA